MRKIAVVTATRAEYGLLAPIVKNLRKYENEKFKTELIVTGTHLSNEYGFTIQEIVEDGLRIDHKIQISTDSGEDIDVSKNQAEALIKFTSLFSNERYNAVILLGDRYETLAFAISAMNTHTPIFHISGGDITEGALDDNIRHAITKMSYLHFVSNEESRCRVIQMGEQPNRVFNFGSTSIDNIMGCATMNRSDVLKSIDLSECNYALCTYHPVTLGNHNVKKQMDEFIKVIQSIPAIEFIVTKSNADQGGKQINRILDVKEKEVVNLHVYDSLGVKRYLSLMKYAEFVLGNSSSGVVETPAFHIPTVNIGDRQKGRLKAESIIDCQEDSASIIKAIEKALSNEMKQICKNVVSPYGDGKSAEKIAQKSVEVINDTIYLQKNFIIYRINNNTIYEEIIYYENLAVIPARSGSKGLKDKNIKLLCNYPLMVYSIRAAQESKLFDEIMVSTDSRTYAEIAVEYGASVPFLRSEELSSDTAGSWDVIKEVLNNYQKKGLIFDTVCLLQPTSPLRTDEDIINGYRELVQKQADAITAVCEMEHSPLWSMTLPDDMSLQDFRKKQIDFPRQQLPKFYRINGALYIKKINYLGTEINLLDSKEYAYIMEKKRSIDIDTIDDFEYAKFLMSKYNSINIYGYTE